MKSPLRHQLRTRLTFWYVLVLGFLLAFYVALVFIFQYESIKRQIFHDEVQDVETVEGLLFFDSNRQLQLQQNYFTHPRSHLLIDRLMEVRDPSGVVLYRSSALDGMSLGGPSLPGEGEDSFNQRVEKLADGSHAFVISHTHAIDGRNLVIRLGYSLAPFRERMRDFLGVLLVALPAALALAGLAGYAIAKRALRPLDEMAARAETITSTNLNQRLEVGSSEDELGHMARVLNLLLDRLESAFRQLQRFTADAAHELRTPLAAIRSTGELALQKEQISLEEHREALGSILEECATLSQTIDDLLTLAKAEAAQPGRGRTTFSLVDLSCEVLAVLEVLSEEKGIVVRQEGVGQAVVQADRGLVRTAVMNLLHNAFKFSPANSVVRISVGVVDTPQTGLVSMIIEDEGPGIRTSEQEQIFERFFTSHAPETASMAGSGIGLSIAKLAIERNNGELLLDASASRGARFLIRLPVADPDERVSPRIA